MSGNDNELEDKEVNAEIVQINGDNLDHSYRSLRKNGGSIGVTLPKKNLERIAKARGMSLKQFMASDVRITYFKPKNGGFWESGFIITFPAEE